MTIKLPDNKGSFTVIPDDDTYVEIDDDCCSPRNPDIR